VSASAVCLRYCQKYWHKLLQYIQDGKVDIRPVFSHRLGLSDASQGYDIFGHQKDDCTKVMLKTPFGIEQDKRRGLTYTLGKIRRTTSA
jgi:hypothetical protein